MINDAVRGYFGFERLPFDRSIPVGALFAIDVHSARLLGRDRRTGAARFEARTSSCTPPSRRRAGGAAAAGALRARRE